MAKSPYGYQYETSPKKLQPDNDTKRKNTNQKVTKNKSVNKKLNKNANEKANKNVKKNVNQKKRAIKYLAIGFVILFAISYRNSLINESFNKKEKLKKELNAMQKTNQQLKVSIENSLNLTNVEQAAKEKLGMQKPTNSQKVYVTLPKKDYIQPAVEEVKLDEEVSWFSKLVNGFTKGIK